jgi:hypothetical protein
MDWEDTGNTKCTKKECGPFPSVLLSHMTIPRGASTKALRIPNVSRQQKHLGKRRDLTRDYMRPIKTQRIPNVSRVRLGFPVKTRAGRRSQARDKEPDGLLGILAETGPG